jgi:phytanoyl-CoA hydroxylase
MNTELTQSQIDFYQENSYIVIEEFLNSGELETWREAVIEVLMQRNGQKMPGKDIKIDEADDINKEADYYNNVFDQLLNLWQTNDKVKRLITDVRIGKMAANLAQVDGIRIWHGITMNKIR